MFERQHWQRQAVYWSGILFWPGVWLAIVAFALWHSWSFEKCIHQIPNQIAQEDYGSSLTFLLAWPTEWAGCLGPFMEINSDAILATFTVVLAASTIFLWRETKGLARGADEQRKVGEAQVRGYLSFKIKSIGSVPLTGDGPHKCRVEITGCVLNTGQTPVYRAQILYEMAAEKTHGVRGFFADGRDLHERGKSALPVAAGGHFNQTVSKKFSISREDVLSGSVIVRLTYIIKYIDVFNTECVTPICDGVFQRHPDSSGRLVFVPGQVERIEN